MIKFSSDEIEKVLDALLLKALISNTEPVDDSEDDKKKGNNGKTVEK